MAEEAHDLQDEELIETDSNIIFSNRVFIGSGIEAGAWAAQLVTRGVSEGAVIVSDQPPGTAPYNRRNLTTTLIDPTIDSVRLFNHLPFCTIPSSDAEVEILQEPDNVEDEKPSTPLELPEDEDKVQIQDMAWYVSHGIKLFSGLTLSEVKFEQKELVFTPLQLSPLSDEEMEDINTTPITIRFGQVCVGTGLNPVLIPGDGPQFGWTVDCAIPQHDIQSGLGSVYESECGSVRSLDERSVSMESEVGEGRVDESVVGGVPPAVQLDAVGGYLEVATPDEYGFGSVHYLSDIGDATKLIYALSRAEEDGQEPVFDPVVVLGGGPAAIEVCSALSIHFPDLSLILVLPTQSLLPSIFSTESSTGEAESKGSENNGEGKGGGPCEELAAFYELQLVKRGIKIARGFEVSRLWQSHEEGNFSTLDGPPSNLRPTRPRPFGPSQPQFKHSRGVVLSPTSKISMDSPGSFAAEEVRLSARLVIVCTEQAPCVPKPLIDAGLRTVPSNNALFSLNNSECDPSVVIVPSVASSALPTSALVVDMCCRTTHPDIFACGACAAFAIHPALKPQSRPGTSNSRKSRGRVESMLVGHLTSPENTAEMARFVANVMADGRVSTPNKRRASTPASAISSDDGADATSSFPFNSTGKFSPVPWLSCTMSELGFRFAGVTQDATPVLVGSTLGYPKFFACIWVRDSRIVGIFLEGGEKRHEVALRTMASRRPRIINIKKLKRVSLDALLNDPFCLEPPVMSFKGEFLAELDDDAVFDALRFFDVDGGGVVKTSSVGAIMAELGSDWDEDELAEAEAAMDPSGRGFVSYETFRNWWGN